MPQANLHVQVNPQHLEFISRYKALYAIEVETIVIQRALELLEQTELIAAYKEMSADETRETEALEWAEVTIVDSANETR